MSHVGEAAIVPRAAGLTVEQAMTQYGREEVEVCDVCHRRRINNVCACRSHPHDLAALVSDTPRMRPAGRAWTPAEIAGHVHTARAAWLDRDWHAVESLIRGLCSQ